MRKFISNYSLLFFFITAYAISWIGIILSFGKDSIHLFNGENVLAGEYSRQLILIWIAMLAGPFLSGIIFSIITEGNQGLKQLLEVIVKWRVSIKWYIIAILLFPATLLFIFLFLSIVSGKFYPSPVLIPGLVVGLVGGFFEEIGWTGFALRKFPLRFGFIKTAIVLGIIHSFWHFFADYLGGVDFYKELYFFHFFLWIVALTALRFIIIWIYRHTGSLLLALLTHASFTGSQLILTPSQLNGKETVLWYSIFVAVLIVLVIVIVLIDMKKTNQKLRF
jgi:membrane protease YdiL (CAAX protease family)